MDMSVKSVSACDGEVIKITIASSRFNCEFVSMGDVSRFVSKGKVPSRRAIRGVAKELVKLQRKE